MLSVQVRFQLPQPRARGPICAWADVRRDGRCIVRFTGLSWSHLEAILRSRRVAGPPVGGSVPGSFWGDAVDPGCTVQNRRSRIDDPGYTTDDPGPTVEERTHIDRKRGFGFHGRSKFDNHLAIEGRRSRVEDPGPFGHRGARIERPRSVEVRRWMADRRATIENRCSRLDRNSRLQNAWPIEHP